MDSGSTRPEGDRPEPSVAAQGPSEGPQDLPSAGGNRPTEATRMGRNFASVALAQFAAQALALLISVTLVRTLGVSNYGIFVFAFAFPNWVLLVVDLGLDSVITIDVAADRSRASDYMTTIAVLRVPLVAAALLVLWFSLGFVLSDPFVRLVTFIIGTSSIIGQFATMFTGVFRGFERLEYVALVTIVGQALTTAFVLGLLLTGFGLVAVALVYLGASLLVLVMSLVFCRRKFAWFAPRVDWALARKILRKTAPFGISDVLSTFLLSTAPVLLTLLVSSTATGIFNAGFAIVNALRAPLGLYYLSVLPTMSRFHGQAREKLGITIQKSQKLLFILGLPMALGGWFYRDAIMALFYGPSVVGAGQSFGILIFTVAITTAVLGMGTALSATGHQTLSLMFGVIGVSVNIALCFLLIPVLGAEGASLAFLVATLIMAVASAIAVDRLVAKIAYVSTLARTFLAGAAMLSVLFLLNGLPLWAGIVVGASVYFGALVIMRGIGRDDWDLLKQIARGALFR